MIYSYFMAYVVYLPLIYGGMLYSTVYYLDQHNFLKKWTTNFALTHTICISTSMLIIITGPLFEKCMYFLKKKSLKSNLHESQSLKYKL